MQLLGDLTGTADSPTIATDAITSTKIKDGEIVNVIFHPLQQLKIQNWQQLLQREK
jgi:hypothetical protein